MGLVLMMLPMAMLVLESVLLMMLSMCGWCLVLVCTVANVVCWLYSHQIFCRAASYCVWEPCLEGDGALMVPWVLV